MSEDVSSFNTPTPFERFFNRVFGFLVGIGLGLPHNYLVQVRGRKTGRIYSTLIDLLELNGKKYLVAPRGRTQWVRNAEVIGEVTLKKGSSRLRYRLQPIPDKDKPEVLKAYLDRFKPTVQRYFPIAAGSNPSAFVSIASQYPVFELVASEKNAD